MLIIFLFSIFLLFFWLENVFGLKISNIKGISLLNLSLYLMLLTWAFKALKRKTLFISNSINTYLLILICIVLFSLPLKFLLNEQINSNLFHDIISFKGWLNPLLLFFILYNIIDNEKTCKQILTILILFLFTTLVTMQLEFLGLVHLEKLKIVQGARTAGFAEPNQYAAFLVLFIPFICSCVIFSNKSLINRLLYLVILLFSLIGIIATGSRGGVISLLAAITIYLFFAWRQGLVKAQNIFLILLFFSMVPTIAYIVSPSEVKQTVKERFIPSTHKSPTELTSGRTILWKNGFKLFLKSPLFGHGHATFIPLMKKNFKVWGNSHNDYLLYLVEYGLIGFLVFVMIFYKLFQETRRLLIESKTLEDKRLFLSYLAGLTGYMVAMLGVNILQPRFLFWAYTATILKYGYIKQTKSSKLHGATPHYSN